MSSNTLDKTFNMGEAHPEAEEPDDGNTYIDIDIELSENPTMEEIKNAALKVYRAQILGINGIEPKYRSRAYEVSNQTLHSAIDAAHKHMDAKLKWHKQQPTAELTEEIDNLINRRDVVKETTKLRRQSGDDENEQ